MDSIKLSKEIWKIVDSIKEDGERGYEYFIQSHKNIPDDFYEVFCIELEKMCANILRENSHTTPTTIIFNKILIYLRNEYEIINPIAKLKFSEDPKVHINSFVKYFSLLRKEQRIKNSIKELSKILESITNFDYDTIFRYLSEHNKHLGKAELLLPKEYMEKPKTRKSRPSS
jgi:hypothetical protein